MTPADPRHPPPEVVAEALVAASLTLWQVTGPRFCAGLETDAAGFVVSAAPILRWAVGQSRAHLRGHFARKGWPVRYVSGAVPAPGFLPGTQFEADDAR